jgi:hypothetical protein
MNDLDIKSDSDDEKPNNEFANKIDDMEQKIKILQSDYDRKINEYERYLKDYGDKKKVKLY